MTSKIVIIGKYQNLFRIKVGNMNGLNKKKYLAPSDRNRLRLRLAYLIYEMGMTKKEAAGLIGINENTVRLWLNELRINGEDNVKALARDKDSLNAFAARVKKRW